LSGPPPGAAGGARQQQYEYDEYDSFHGCSCANGLLPVDASTRMGGRRHNVTPYH
jgi:hypothetical protein